MMGRNMNSEDARWKAAIDNPYKQPRLADIIVVKVPRGLRICYFWPETDRLDGAPLLISLN